MSNLQKVIKYGAVAFGLFLAFSIIFGITTFVLSLTGVLNNDKDFDNLNEIKINNVMSLDIDVKSASIVIKEGKNFKVETDNDNIKVLEKNNELRIIEKKLKLFKNDNKVVIILPSSLVFEKVKIDAGAGTIDFYQLQTKKLDIDLGAGSAYIENLIVYENASIDGGAGKIVIYDGKINDLELDMGVGELDLTSKITGSSEIDAGVGSVKLNLLGTKDNYKIKASKGLGSFKIEDESIANGTIYGSGNNFIDISGGIGSININFK